MTWSKTASAMSATAAAGCADAGGSMDGLTFDKGHHESSEAAGPQPRRCLLRDGAGESVGQGMLAVSLLVARNLVTARCWAAGPPP